MECTMTDTENQLYDLERGFWTEGPEFYIANADDRCLVCFPGLVRVLSRQELSETVKSGPRWHDVQIQPKAVVEPAPGVVVIAYEGSAECGDEGRYHAAVSSGYVKRNGKWKLAWHQQTPL